MNYICEKCVVGIIRRYGRQIPIVTLMLSSKRRTKKKRSVELFFFSEQKFCSFVGFYNCSVFSLGSRTLKVNDATKVITTYNTHERTSLVLKVSYVYFYINFKHKYKFTLYFEIGCRHEKMHFFEYALQVQLSIILLSTL